MRDDQAKRRMNAIKLHPDDTVAVLVADVEANDPIVLSHEEAVTVVAAEPIPYGHKVALAAMKKGDRVVKYGEHMGVVTQDIPLGCHVHVHNVRGLETDERGGMEHA